MAVPITLEMLIQKNACNEQIQKFKVIFGFEAPLSIESAINNSKDFNWYWAALTFLNEENVKKFSSVSDKAWDEYTIVRDNKYYNFIEIRNKSGSEFCDKAWKEYNLLREKSFNKFKLIQAKTFSELYLSQ